MTIYEVRRYKTVDGKVPLQIWLDRIKDGQTRSRIEVRVARLERGLLGDAKPLRQGVSELRIDVGPGYRVYFAVDGPRIILLLCGGSKATQQKDIQDAIRYWQDYKTRTE